jgi:3-hydroxybutyryl-CoA dehydrogenase
MGSGIAQVAALAGYRVLLYDITEEILSRALISISRSVHRAAEKGTITAGQAEATVARITTTTRLEDTAQGDFIIEAVPENLDLKRSIFAELDIFARPRVTLATNTNTFSITAIAAATDHPWRVVGMHFFNPAPQMPLVEVIVGAETDPVVVETTMALAARLGKKPVRANDMPGFIVNRITRPFFLEGLRLVEQGVADHATIDRLVRDGGGFRMGPFELMDLIGLDIDFAASQAVYDAFFHAPRFRPSLRQQRMVQSKRLGRKTGRGWYDYGEEQP